MTDGRQVLAIEATDGRQWSFNLGDLQEHKYSNPDVWSKEEDELVPHKDTAEVEDVHKLVIDHFNPDHAPYEDDHGKVAAKEGDFMTDWAVHEEAERQEHSAMLEAYSRPYKEVPSQLVDDWTATRYGKHWRTYGEAPWPPVAEALDERGFPEHENRYAD